MGVAVARGVWDAVSCPGGGFGRSTCGPLWLGGRTRRHGPAGLRLHPHQRGLRGLSSHTDTAGCAGQCHDPLRLLPPPSSRRHQTSLCLFSHFSRQTGASRRRNLAAAACTMAVGSVSKGRSGSRARAAITKWEWLWTTEARQSASCSRVAQRTDSGRGSLKRCRWE